VSPSRFQDINLFFLSFLFCFIIITGKLFPYYDQVNMKNYYIILDIEPDATLEEIKAAYRRLAKEVYPDYYDSDTKPFRELQEAYTVLSNREFRRAYDKMLGREREEPTPEYEEQEPAEQRAGPVSEEGPVDLGEISLTSSFETFRPSFEEVFDHLMENFFGEPRKKATKNKSFNCEIILSPEEARRGGRAYVLIPVVIPCPACRGRGFVESFDCIGCNGAGKIAEEHPVKITFPAGVTRSHTALVYLDHLGIQNFYLTVHFRVSREAV
jgi:molecular chaperone DnaJ